MWQRIPTLCAFLTIPALFVENLIVFCLWCYYTIYHSLLGLEVICACVSPPRRIWTYCSPLYNPLLFTTHRSHLHSGCCIQKIVNEFLLEKLLMPHFCKSCFPSQQLSITIYIIIMFVLPVHWDFPESIIRTYLFPGFILFYLLIFFTPIYTPPIPSSTSTLPIHYTVVCVHEFFLFLSFLLDPSTPTRHSPSWAVSL